MFEKTKIRYAKLSAKVPPKVKDLLKKVPFGFLSLFFLLLTYFVGGILGMLVIPALLAILFILPWSIVFAVLDIVIRKKKIIPIICLCEGCFTYFGTIGMLIYMAVNIINE